MLLMRAAGMTSRHYAEHGLVSCPVRGVDVEVESCLRCRALRAVTDDRTCVICDGQAPDRADDRPRAAERPT